MKVDFHVYTDKSLGKNSIAEMVAVAKKKGLDAIAVVDRGVLGWTNFKPKNFVVIPGVEIMTEKGPILVYGAEKLPEKTYLGFVLDWAKDWGYVVVPSQFNAKGGLGDLALEKFKIVEAINGSQPPWVCKEAVKFATSNGKQFIAGSGARSVKWLGDFYTVVEGETADDVIRSLKRGNFEPRIKFPGMAHFLSSKFG